MTVKMHGTTVVLVRKKDTVVLGADGQVSMGSSILKGNACKIRLLYHGNVLAGFAGATADAFTLFELFENKLESYQGQLIRSAVELAKDWRTDKMLKRLEALLLVADRKSSLLITGDGDVIEPETQVMAIGSGGDYARAAAQALLDHTQLSAERIVKKSLAIAADICVYTNHHAVLESLRLDNKKAGKS